MEKIHRQQPQTGEHPHRRREVERAAELQRLIDEERSIDGWVIQGVDLGEVHNLERIDVSGSIWLGCRFADDRQAGWLTGRGAAVFPALGGLPYQPYRTRLYSVQELMAGYDEGGYTATTDFAIYAHAHRERSHPGGVSLGEALAERLHDHAIDDALAEHIAACGTGGIVGVMGGHGTPRSDPYYRKVARVAAALAREGYLVVTGGGPGVMEAANLGAWLSGACVNDDGAIDDAIAILRQADTMSGGHAEGTPAYLEAIRDYIRRAQEVVDRFAASPGFSPGSSLAVPTWFYGHEPSNLFSTAIAKYFDNSIREEGLLAIAKAGVIYAPGSAGTMQEIFQDLTQNHYGTYGWRSPMVMLGVERYGEVHRLISDFARARGAAATYGDLLLLTDDVEQIAAFIRDNPPRQLAPRRPLYELL